MRADVRGGARRGLLAAVGALPAAGAIVVAVSLGGTGLVGVAHAQKAPQVLSCSTEPPEGFVVPGTEGPGVFVPETLYCVRTVEVPGAGNSEDGGIGWGWLPILFLIGAAGGFAAGRYLGTGMHKAPGRPAHAPAAAQPATGPDSRPVVPAPVDPAVARAAGERDTLVRACIDLSDHLQDRDTGLWNRLRGKLSAVGVESIVPDGQHFDPDRYDATGYETATDPNAHLTVASTSFAGFVDHGRELRRPAVVVYRTDSRSEP